MKKLLDILVEELPNQGGWPEGINYMAQDSKDSVFSKRVYGYKEKPFKNSEFSWSNPEEGAGGFGTLIFKAEECAVDCMESLITRDEYYAGLEEKGIHTVPVHIRAIDTDGWIEWRGGACPVETGTLVDVRYRDNSENHHIKAGVWANCGSDPYRSARVWRHIIHDFDIIAYRLYQPQNSTQFVDVTVNFNREDAQNDSIVQKEATSKNDSLVLQMLSDMQDCDIELSLNNAFALAEHMVELGYCKDKNCKDKK